MPISWVTVLQAVPWGDVINNAPKVADGAKKLWKSVSGKEGAAPAQEAAPASAGSVNLEALQARLQASERAVAELHEQMLASSELIQALAEQNAQLVQRVETHRRRVVWLTAATVLLGALAIAALVFAR